MNFLEWLGFKKVMDELEPKNVVKLPVDYVKPVEPPKPPPPEEHYRVGFDTDGRTTLTLIAGGGGSMTLSMNQDACEKLIRMLRSTYQDENE